MTNYVREIYNWSTGPACEPYMRCVEKKDGIGGMGWERGLLGHAILPFYTYGKHVKILIITMNALST